MAINEYLQSLEEQQVQETRQIVVVNDPILEYICNKYDVWQKDGRAMAYTREVYGFCLDYLEERSFTAKVIQNFSVVLKKYEHYMNFSRTGIFLSALINTSEEENFEVLTAHLQKKLNWVGMRLDGKNVIVKGSTGLYTGHELSGGKIIVTENAGMSTGSGAAFGEIHVEGKIGSISYDNNANIYHKGKQIWLE